MLKAVIFLVVLGTAVYFLVRAYQQKADGGSVRPARPARPSLRPKAKATPPPVVAPDDDEDFLRELDRRRLFPEDPDA